MRSDDDRLLALSDTVLIAITDGKPVTRDMVCELPPWRAVLLARVAAKVGLMDEATVAALVEESAHVGGSGRLAPAQARV